MKKVQAEFRKDRFEVVDSALKRIGVPGLTFVEEERATSGPVLYPMDKVKRVLLTIVVDDAGAEKVVESIRDSAWTGSWGDGRIAVTKLDGVYDIASQKLDHSGLFAPRLGV